MANIKQQKKRIRVAQRQRLENLRYRSAIKTYMKRLTAKVNEGDADAVASEHRALVKLIDKASSKRAIHPNTAGRKKSRAARVVAARRDGPFEILAGGKAQRAVGRKDEVGGIAGDLLDA